MRDLIRQLGVGRYALRFFHQPLGDVRKSWRAGGPWQQRRTRLGQLAMEAAARTLPPLPAPPQNAPVVHLLTGESLWYQTAFFVLSLSRFLPVRPIIHSDGSLEGESLALLRRVLPFGVFIEERETNEHIKRLLPLDRYPSLRRRRSELVLFRKLIDVHLGQSGWNLFLDSDMLVYREPRFLATWLNAPTRACHMTDAARAYGYPLRLLEKLAGRGVPDLVNTGILGLQSETIDWDRLERWCAALNTSPKPHYYQEQALTAMLLAHETHLAIPRAEYVVLPRPPEATACTAVLHHYVAESKRWYFQQNWRRFAPTAA